MRELIDALRCSASPKATRPCDGCLYLLTEYLEPGDQLYDLILADSIEPDGTKIYKSCDVDRMVYEAADSLEELTRGVDDGR